MIEIPPPCTLGGWVGYYNYVEHYSFVQVADTMRLWLPYDRKQEKVIADACCEEVYDKAKLIQLEAKRAAEGSSVRLPAVESEDEGEEKEVDSDDEVEKVEMDEDEDDFDD